MNIVGINWDSYILVLLFYYQIHNYISGLGKYVYNASPNCNINVFFSSFTKLHSSIIPTSYIYLENKKGFTTAQYKMQIKNVEKLFLSRNIGFSVWIYSRLDRSSCIGSEWGKNVDSYHLLLHFLIFQSGLYLSTPDKILLFILSLCENTLFFHSDCSIYV